MYDRAALMPGDTIAGPAVIEQLDSTTLLFPGDRATVDPYLNLDCRDFAMSIDPITLEIMSNGFKSIADETYIALMKSAYSTNIKERHDHSTAIIDPRRAAHRAGGELAGDSSRLDDGPDEHAARQDAALRRARGRHLHLQRSLRGRRLASAGREHGDAGVRRRQARLLHVQHRASRRHRRHHAGQHGGRHRDLSGRHAHPGDPPVPRAASCRATSSTCCCSTRACRKSGAAIISRRSRRAAWACGASAK